MTRVLYWGSADSHAECQGLSPSQALKKAGLDYKVELRESAMGSSKGEGYVTDPYNRYIAKVGSDEIISRVGGKYFPVQHSDALRILEDIVGSSQVEVESVWESSPGDVWISSRYGDPLDMGGVDPVQPYLLWANSHSGKRSLKLIGTTVQMQCLNQLPRIMGETRHRASVVHSTAAHDRLEAADNVLLQFDEYLNNVETEVTALLADKLTSKKAETAIMTICSKFIASPATRVKACEEIKRLYRESPTAEHLPKDNKYRLMHAFTEYTDHVRPYRSAAARYNALAPNGLADMFKERAAKAILAL